MAYIDEQLLQFKTFFEAAIMRDGIKGKESIIRSSSLINLIHDAVKHELIQRGIDPQSIYPNFEKTKPEMKIAGFLKQKNQDVCVAPKNIRRNPRRITWGPLANENVIDTYGEEFTKNTLVINVRSQMSSIAKNTDTLFERTFAEALNLHMMYKDIVLGEVYLIPVYEYDEATMDNREITFKPHQTNVAKYISFFSAINGRANQNDDLYKYERCTLLIVDFRQDQPILYRTTEQLITAGLLPNDFPIRFEPLSFDNFTDDILIAYSSRFTLENLK